MYTYKKSVPMGYEDTVARVRDELKKEGFGVLTKIDVKQTLKTKLNVEFDDYTGGMQSPICLSGAICRTGCWGIAPL